jgi:RNA polymerase sigma factor (sigma-70 family)
MNKQDLLPHLFRTESGKIAAVLCRYFSIGRMEIAEDITSETFLLALETWPYKGIPENPVAWLYTVAKNKAKNYAHRQNIFDEKVTKEISANSIQHFETDIDLSDEHISDSQLQMLFALCHPTIPVEAQIGLSLRILCGFGIEEIANAFLTNKETINKRLFRAKEKLRSENVIIELPRDNEIGKRLETVLTTLYLLYNEGYYSESQNNVLREELCHEAMRLTLLLTNSEKTNKPEVNALLSLMYFHASRFPARKNAQGEIVLYQDQQESLWDQDCIARGAYFLHHASIGDSLSRYHLEAGIAYWHTIKTDSREKWENILQLYNKLLQVEYSPIAALNRTYALSKANSPEEAIAEAEKLQLTNNHYYYALLGELYRGIDEQKRRHNLELALSLAKTDSDRTTLAKKLIAN